MPSFFDFCPVCTPLGGRAPELLQAAGSCREASPARRRFHGSGHSSKVNNFAGTNCSARPQPARASISMYMGRCELHPDQVRCQAILPDGGPAEFARPLSVEDENKLSFFSKFVPMCLRLDEGLAVIWKKMPAMFRKFIFMNFIDVVKTVRIGAVMPSQGKVQNVEKRNFRSCLVEVTRGYAPRKPGAVQHTSSYAMAPRRKEACHQVQRLSRQGAGRRRRVAR